jgi:uncharacterized membrane protein
MEALMLRSHCSFACTVGALICCIAPFAVDAQDAGTAFRQDGPRYTTLKLFGAPSESSLNGLSINNRRMVIGTVGVADEIFGGRLVGFARLERFLHPIDFDNAHNVSLSGINDRGDIVGLMNFTDGPSFAFRYSHGELETIIVGGDSPPLLNDINNHGDMVGRATSSILRAQGFLLLSSGQLTLIDPPPDGLPPATIFGINDNRDVVGCSDLRAGAFMSGGFLFRNSAYTLIRVPDARGTCPSDINNRGTIVGAYSDDGSSTHGFVLRNKRYTIVDIPNSISTTITSINDYGDIVGTYRDASFIDHGFKSNIREFIPRRSGQR